MIKYDQKLNPNFTGKIIFIKEEYLSPFYEEDIREIQITLTYHQGELTNVELIGPEKFINADPKRWNGEFWKTAPTVLTFDDCCYKRHKIYYGHEGQNAYGEEIYTVCE